jgi:hypothetical protein
VISLRPTTIATLLLGSLLAGTAACGNSGGPAADSALTGSMGGSGSALPAGITFASQVSPITRVADAKQGVFIPPFQHCQPPKAGEPAGLGPEGQVCANVMISGCTEPGRYYPDYADCSVVLRQRPYWPAPPNKTPPVSDPRLSEPEYLADMTWAAEQLAASGCTCCHDARVAPGGAASQWDISAGPLWIDTVKDSGLGLFAGLTDSDVLGAYPSSENFGFDRSVVGVPTTDSARMQRIMLDELARRGLSEDWARALPPFGGPIYENSVKPAVACGPGQGVSPAGEVLWTGGTARYVYVLEAGGPNPGVPPNLDFPSTTVWRLDVLASAAALNSGISYGATPSGSFQSFPRASAAASLEAGKQYQLFVQFDMAVPITNCLFSYGQPVAPAAPPDSGAAGGTGGTGGAADPGMPSGGGGADSGGADSGGTGSGGACAQPGPDGDPRGIGVTCSTSGASPAECPCAANYCSKSPFDASGYCTVTGCDKDPSVCPTGWSCFNVGTFSPGEPYVCTKP